MTACQGGLFNFIVMNSAAGAHLTALSEGPERAASPFSQQAALVLVESTCWHE
jgi:hypothetical protein